MSEPPCDEGRLIACPWAFSDARSSGCICAMVSAVEVTWSKPGDLSRMSIEAMEQRA